MELNATTMSLLFFVFVLAMFLGVELIRKVPSQLHTPLMSGSNAISGITVVGALLALGHEDSGIVVRCWRGWPWRLRRSTSSAAISSPTACWRCSRARTAGRGRT